MKIQETGIYICHYTKLKDRKLAFDNQLEKFGLTDNTMFITDYDYDELNDNDLQHFDDRALTLKEISLFIKHIQSWKNIVSSGKDYGIVMEDDCIFNDNFVDDFNNLLINYPENFDILYVGTFPFYKQNPTPVPQHADLIGNFHDMTNQTVFPWTGNNKGTDFYIISAEYSKKLIASVESKDLQDLTTPSSTLQANNVCMAIDWWIGQYSHILNAKIYWLNKEISKHGSWGDDKIFSNSLLDQRGF